MDNKLSDYRALVPFVSQPKESMHLSAISRQLGRPRPTVRLWLESLAAKGVLRKTKRGRNTEYRLNIEQESIIDHLAVAEKINLIGKCEESLRLREIVHAAHRHSRMALIFGSAAAGYSKAGDIDLLIIGNYNRNEFRKLGKRISKSLHIIAVSELSKINNALLREIIKSHLLIKGTEEFIRCFIWPR